jgi:hypothetical protein
MKIFVGQSALRVVVKTFCDLSGYVSVSIKYRKPDGKCGVFPAGVADAAKGVLVHECGEGDIDKAGWWSFWANVTFGDGRTAAGAAEKIFVWKEGI